MAFTPVVPFSGLMGYRFVERTYDKQLETFLKSPDVEREIDYFLAHAGEAKTAEDLVSDRRLLKVALGAFGLDDEVDKRAFVQKILEEGTLDPKAMANRLADPAWTDLTVALGYGDLGGLLIFNGTQQSIVEKYRQRQFERAVGEVDLDVRLAMNFKRAIADIAADPAADSAGWFKIMGSQPLRTVIEGTFGLPTGFGKMDIDRQRDELESRALDMFGSKSPAVFADAANVDEAIRRYLIRAELANGISATAPGATALTLLQGSGLGSGAQASLFASNL